MTLRPCLDCGNTTRSTTSRCGPCERNRQHLRNQRRQHLYGGEWRAFSRRQIKAQPWCSICGVNAGYEVLTFDHEHWQVECRPCNSSHRRNVGAG